MGVCFCHLVIIIVLQDTQPPYFPVGAIAALHTGARTPIYPTTPNRAQPRPPLRDPVRILQKKGVEKKRGKGKLTVHNAFADAYTE